MDYPKFSRDELSEKFHEGTAGLAQVRKSEDGSVRYFDVYGDMHDGIDYSLNIFFDKEAYFAAYRGLMHGKLHSLDASKKKNGGQKNTYKGFQITADQTDDTVMLTLFLKDGAAVLEMYERDENKSFMNPIEKKRWEDRNSILTAEGIKEDSMVRFYYVLMGVSIYLTDEGVLDQLRELKKYSSAGVIITADGEDEISHRVVWGKDRPDLLCDVFLLGEQYCRPYLDEKMGLNNNTIQSEEVSLQAARAEVLTQQERWDALFNGDNNNSTSNHGAYRTTDFNVRGKDELVLETLAGFGEPKKVKAIAEATGLSAQTVTASLKRLYADGRVVRTMFEGITLYEADSIYAKSALTPEEPERSAPATATAAETEQNTGKPVTDSMPAGTESVDDPKDSAKGLDYEDKKILAVLATFDDSIPAKTVAQISRFDFAETEKRLNILHSLGNVSVYESEGAPLYLYNNGLPDAVYKKIVLERAKKDKDDLEKKITLLKSERDALGPLGYKKKKEIDNKIERLKNKVIEKANIIERNS